MSDTDQKLEDDVLRRMLATKPTPHKAKQGQVETRPRRSQDQQDKKG